MIDDKELQINKRLRESGIPPKFIDRTFENYVVKNDGQKNALVAVRDLVASMDSTGLILIGKPGTGKNHLSCAAISSLIKDKDKTGLITTAMKFVREIKESWRGGINESKVIRRHVKPDLLVIDEVGIQFGSDTERLYLNEIINERYEQLKPTILIGNVTMRQLGEQLGERVIDRFKEGGKVVVFDWESERGRV
jgi:DNA replication protein DnaC